ncbi:hypothetical protein ACFYO1_32790 [Nocardia sp. NPDC006044]|uniref:hypothetical protein n=1 Tax=Nocardia sp. NPDC006044 TaxID=3364306 RepID=UPI0036BC886B
MNDKNNDKKYKKWFTIRVLTNLLAAMGIAVSATWIFCLIFPWGLGFWLWWLGADFSIGALWLLLRLIPPSVPVNEANVFATSYKTNGIVRALMEEAFEMTAKYDKEVLALLADMMVEPETYRHRVTENLELGRWVTKRSVTMDLVIDEQQYVQVEEKPSILVPLIEPTKGWLFDRLAIHPTGDEPVVSLAYGGQSAALYIAVLIHQFHITYPDLPADFKDWPWDRYAALQDIVTTVSKSAAALRAMSKSFANNSRCRKSKPSEEDRQRLFDEVIKAHQEDLDLILVPRSVPVPAGARTAHGEAGVGDEELAVQEVERNKLRRIARLGIAHYLVIVQCKPAKYLKLAYSYEQSTGSFLQKPTRSETSTLARILQKLSGIPSGYLKVGLTRASHAKSYHMHASVPDGSYVRLAYVTDDANRAVMVNARPSIAVNIPYLRPVGKSVTSLHVYGRNLSSIREKGGRIIPIVRKLDRGVAELNSQPVSLGLRARICERPTGTELFATIVAWSVLLVTIILREAAEAEAHTDVAVAVLALPAAIAALAVFFVRAFERSLLVSIAGSALTMASTVLAVTVTFIFAFRAASTKPGMHADDWSHWVVYWQILLTLVVVVVIATTGMLVIRTKRYVSSRFKSDT